MNPASTVLLGLAMSTDAFAAAVGKGAGMARPRWRDALRVGAIFGTVEALTPLLGWLLGAVANRFVRDWDHWVAFGLLSLLGLHMLHKALSGDAGAEAEGKAGSGGLLGIALAGLATSIDALAVGVGLAFVEVNIVVAAATIGLCTFAMVSIGIMAGRALGSLIGRRAEIAGGLILIAVGAAILYEHLSGAAG